MKAALYLRVAGDDGGEALRWQEANLREWAQAQGHEVVAVYQDTAPGTSLDRPGLQSLLGEMDKNRFEAVAVHGFSRLVREPALVPPLAKTFRRSGIKLLSPNEPSNVFSGYAMALDALKKDYYQGRSNKENRNK